MIKYGLEVKVESIDKDMALRLKGCQGFYGLTVVKNSKILLFNSSRERDLAYFKLNYDGKINVLIVNTPIETKE